MQSSPQGYSRRPLRFTAVLLASISFSLLNIGSAADHERSSQSLTRRLQAAEDRVNIEELITSDYSTALDTRDAKRFSSLFVENGELSVLDPKLPPKELKGRAVIEKYISASPSSGKEAGSIPLDMPVSTKHVITNPLIKVDGNNATATAFWMEVVTGNNRQVSIRAIGYHSDVLTRDKGTWRFRRQEVLDYDLLRIDSAARPPAGLATGAATVVDSPPAVQSVAQQLQAIEDEGAIRQLVSPDYSRALDTSAWKTLALLFTEDGQFIFVPPGTPPTGKPFKECKGRPAIEKSLSGSPPSSPSTSSGQTSSPPTEGPAKHFIANPRIQIDGDSATSTAYWIEVGTTKDGKVVIPCTGYYSDVLKRDHGAWRFQRREVH